MAQRRLQQYLLNFLPKWNPDVQLVMNRICSPSQALRWTPLWRILPHLQERGPRLENVSFGFHWKHRNYIHTLHLWFKWDSSVPKSVTGLPKKCTTISSQIWLCVGPDFRPFLGSLQSWGWSRENLQQTFQNQAPVQQHHLGMQNFLPDRQLAEDKRMVPSKGTNRHQAVHERPSVVTNSACLLILLVVSLITSLSMKANIPWPLEKDSVMIP